MHVTHMHRYMAIPRTPVQTDRLDTTEASAVYRASRESNKNKVKLKHQNCHILFFYRESFISLKNELLPAEVDRFR